MENNNENTVLVCDIQFRDAAKVYYFNPNSLQIKAGDEVVIETARGPEYGRCVRGNHTIPQKDVVTPLRPVLRIATSHDRRVHEENQTKERRAYAVCRKKIEEFGLPMQLVSAEYAFDGSKVLFFFTADGRVDFRELVKSVASTLRTRIELRQIGVRDKAKLVGGLGVCGRPFCCRAFLDDFQPVSIRMAKTQGLSLNPTKISGTCGRLMCCLNYEQEAYEDLIRTSPKLESFVDTPDGRGTVSELDLLHQSVRVRLEKQPDTVVCHKNCDICVLRNGKPKKNDEPIPDDLAPISGNRKVKAEEPSAFSTYLEPVLIRGEMPPSEEERDDAKQRRRGKKKGKQRDTDPTAPHRAKEPKEPRQPKAPRNAAQKKQPQKQSTDDAANQKPSADSAARQKPSADPQKQPTDDATPRRDARPETPDAPNEQKKRPNRRHYPPRRKPKAES